MTGLNGDAGSMVSWHRDFIRWIPLMRGNPPAYPITDSVERTSAPLLPVRDLNITLERLVGS